MLTEAQKEEIEIQQMVEELHNRFDCDYCDDHECDRCHPKTQKVTFWDGEIHSQIIKKNWLGTPIRFKIEQDGTVWISRNDLVDKLDKLNYEAWTAEDRLMRYYFLVDAACDYQQHHIEIWNESECGGLPADHYGVWEFAKATLAYAHVGYLPTRFYNWLNKTLPQITE